MGNIIGGTFFSLLRTDSIRGNIPSSKALCWVLGIESCRHSTLTLAGAGEDSVRDAANSVDRGAIDAVSVSVEMTVFIFDFVCIT